MWDFHHTLNIEELPDGETVFCVIFPDASTYGTWWLVANGGVVNLCTDDPGKDVDLYISSDIDTMVGIWMGDLNVKAAMEADDVKLTGASHLMRSIGSWFPRSRFADIRPERIME